MKNKFVKIAAIVLIALTLAIPVLADSQIDFNVDLPALRGWKNVTINADSSGPYAYIRLYANGEVNDEVEFVVMSPTNEEVTTRGVAVEGAQRTTRVNYIDGQSTRKIQALSMRSNYQNWLGGYPISGYFIY